MSDKEYMRSTAIIGHMDFLKQRLSSQRTQCDLALRMAGVSDAHRHRLLAKYDTAAEHEEAKYSDFLVNSLTPDSYE